MDTEHVIVRAIAVVLLPCMISAVVLSNQPLAEIQVLGRLCHYTSIAASVALLSYATRGWATPYILLVAGLFIFGVITGQRLPYEIFLNVLFLAAGIVSAYISRGNLTSALLALTLGSGAFMLLQVLGVGEWTQSLTTNGMLPGGGSIQVPLQSTFLVSAADFQGSFLQGRPSGLFHSNQFACLVVLVSFALTVTDRRPVNFLIGFALCCVAVLLLSKVVLLGTAVMIAALFVMGDRKTAAIYLTMMVGALALYAAVFPGLFQLFLFNPHVVVVSLVVRLIDMAASAGLDAGAAMRWLETLGLIEAGHMNDALIGRIVADNATAGRSTAFVTLARYVPILISAAAALFLTWLSIPGVRHAARAFSNAATSRNILVALGLIVFCLAADFLSAGVFWAFVGLAIPTLGGFFQPAFDSDRRRARTAGSEQAAA